MLDDFTERRRYNAVTDFVDANVVRGLGNKIAFVDPDRSLTFGALQTRSVRCANALRALGLKDEKRVALLLHDTVDYPVAFWGTIRAGAVAIPLNTFLNELQYAYMLADFACFRACHVGVAGAENMADHRSAASSQDGHPG